MASSSRSLAGGGVAGSALAWSRRSATPGELTACTTGMPRSRVAIRAGSPLVQLTACTTSGRSRRQRARSGSLNAGTRASSSASPRLPTAPTGMCTTRRPPGSARSGTSGGRFCASTVTLCPCRARIRVSSLSPAPSGRGSAPARRCRGWHTARRWRSSSGASWRANLRHGVLPWRRKMMPDPHAPQLHHVANSVPAS